jgi:hypothetical protein
MIINNVEDLTLMLFLTNNELFKATYFETFLITQLLKISKFYKLQYNSSPCSQQPVLNQLRRVHTIAT